MIIREPKTIVVTPTDLWAIQKAISFNTFMIDPRNGQSIFPLTIKKYGDGEVVYVHTAWKLRDKCNRLLLRMADEHTSEELLPLDYDECWYIDLILGMDSYAGDGTKDDLGLTGSKRILISVFRCIYEHEQMISLAEGITGADVDPQFRVSDLADYLKQAEGDNSKGWSGPAAGATR